MLQVLTLITLDTRKEEKKRIPVYLHLGNEKIWRLFKFPMFFRWFLLDFKREFAYCDIFLVWETIWASRKVTSSHFYLFVALALVENYRDIILDRNMDFTDIIKFFNEMAEKHDGRSILTIARELVHQLQTINADQ